MNRRLKNLLIIGTLLSAVVAVSFADETTDNKPIYSLEASLYIFEELPPKLNNPNLQLSDKQLKKLLKHDPMLMLIGTPKVTVRAGREAKIIISHGVQYFEHIKDDTYKLKTLSDETDAGVFLTAIMTPHGRDKVGLSIGFRFTTLKSREKLPGLNLDVGAPIMNSNQTDTHVVVEPDTWAVLGISTLTDTASGKPECLVIMGRVTVTDP